MPIKNNELQDFDIIVNTTPLGTKGELESQTPVTSAQFSNVKLALDLIYNPSKTQFMREAENPMFKLGTDLECLPGKQCCNSRFGLAERRRCD